MTYSRTTLWSALRLTIKAIALTVLPAQFALGAGALAQAPRVDPVWLGRPTAEPPPGVGWTLKLRMGMLEEQALWRLPRLRAYSPARVAADSDPLERAPAQPSVYLTGSRLKVEQPAGTVNMLLLGSDRQDPSYGVSRTDTIILASLDPGARSVTLLSIPRDLWVEVPGAGQARINAAVSIGARRGGDAEGYRLLQEVVSDSLGIEVHHYVAVDFFVFADVIDDLGGVDVAVGCAVRDYFGNPAALGGLAPVDLAVGIHHLDGQTALRYARSRRSGNDFARNRRQQEVLRAMWHKTREQDLLRFAPILWSRYRHRVATDMSLADMLTLARKLYGIRGQGIKSRFVDLRHVRGWRTPVGAAVLLPDSAALRDSLQEYLTPSGGGEARGRVTLVDGSGRPGWADVAASRLREQGYNVETHIASAHTRTSLILHLPPDRAPAEALARHMGLSAAATRSSRSVPDDDRPGLTLLLGSDWEPCRDPA